MNKWFENDEFWKDFEPVLFDQNRRAAADEEVRQVLDLVGGLTGMDVLDMPCGPGRHSLALSRRGFRVTGVDRTTVYLEEARKGGELEELQIELVASDMRRFVRSDSFDLAINLFSSFGYFEDPADDRTVAKNFYHSLRDGGTLVIDTMSKEVVARDFTEHQVHRIEDGSLWIEERKLHTGWDWIENKWTFVKSGEIREFTVANRLYSATELAALLREVGFSNIMGFGNLLGAPYDYDADRLIMVARKNS